MVVGMISLLERPSADKGVEKPAKLEIMTIPSGVTIDTANKLDKKVQVKARKPMHDLSNFSLPTT